LTQQWCSQEGSSPRRSQWGYVFWFDSLADVRQGCISLHCASRCYALADGCGLAATRIGSSGSSCCATPPPAAKRPQQRGPCSCTSSAGPATACATACATAAGGGAAAAAVHTGGCCVLELAVGDVVGTGRPPPWIHLHVRV
jgi:hypothetical protein